MMLIDSRFEQEYIEAKKYCKMSKWNFIGVSLFFLPLSIAMMYVLGHIFLVVIGKEPMNISLFQFIVLSVIIASLLIAMITLEIYFFLTYKRLKNHVKDFTFNEKQGMTKDIIKDWIAPIIIGTIATPAAVTLYEMAVTGYDIKVTIDDIKEQKVDENDILMYICEDDIYNQIEEKYLNKHKELVLKKIKEINQQTYNLIDLSL